MKKKYIYFGLSFALVLVVGLGIFWKTSQTTHGVTGSDFDAGRIVDDAIFFNKDSMNPGDIQNFLNAKVPTCDTNGTQPKNGVSGQTRAQWAAATGNPAPPYVCVRNYTQSIPSVTADAYCNGIGGGTKSAADIIFNVAQACNINPQALIVLLQKEQTLITDDWPWPIQYQSATGYGCPDTAACDAQYYGFFNQLYNAARQFKRYVQQPQAYNYAVGRNSFVQYNPNASCGGTNITMQTQATAALYNYTPYQPNAAALNNLGGSGDSCSAYGNRNFWLFFNNWFGPTRTDSFTIAIGDNGSPNQYLLFGGIKQAIPDPETKIAWGIQNYPVITMPASYLTALPSGPYLDRLTRLNTSDNTVFFMDGGKRYRIMSQTMFDAWNFGGRPITSVPPGLFYVPVDAGELTYSVKDPASSKLYMLDGANGSGQTVLRQYQTDSVFAAWEGDGAPFISLSANFFDQIDNAIGSALTTTKVAYGGNEYQAISKQKMPQPIGVAALYPGVAQSVSGTTFNRLNTTSTATHLVRAASSPQVYLIDNGMKHHILWPDLLTAWKDPSTQTNIVNDGYMSLIPPGADITGYIADNAGQAYVIDRQKTPVPSGVDTAYRNTQTVYSATTTLLNQLPTASLPATGFIKGVNTPQIYLLDNSGKRRHMEWADKVSLWGGYQTGVTILSDYVINSITANTSPGIFVTDGTSNYVMENGRKLTVSAGVQANWGLASPQLYSDGTLSRFPTNGSLGNSLKDNGFYYYVRDGKGFVTVDINIANAWAIDSAPALSNKLITSFVPQYILARFMQSSVPGDNRVFAVDNGNWYNLSAAQRSNLGSSNEAVMTLNPSNAPNTITDWANIVVKDWSGRHYVIDGGTKHFFANTIIQNHWTSNGSLAVPTVSTGFLNLLPNAGPIERAIKGSSPSVYSAEGATKRHILSPTTFNQFYAPYAQVSDRLLEAMPTGPDI